MGLADMLTAVKLVSSKAKRCASSKRGVYVNNVRATDERARLMAADAIGGAVFVLRKGRRIITLSGARRVEAVFRPVLIRVQRDHAVAVVQQQAIRSAARRRFDDYRLQTRRSALGIPASTSSSAPSTSIFINRIGRRRGARAIVETIVDTSNEAPKATCPRTGDSSGTRVASAL
jgi:hypothetical protein